mmetsp:Transcript_8075/g.29991  ORF Transcript_8075/g.29991 Transcript_8075/m.29991 type:complete len:236 (-) Transcript_8075:1932-2639(-)
MTQLLSDRRDARVIVTVVTLSSTSSFSTCEAIGKHNDEEHQEQCKDHHQSHHCCSTESCLEISTVRRFHSAVVISNESTFQNVYSRYSGNHRVNCIVDKGGDATQSIGVGRVELSRDFLHLWFQIENGLCEQLSLIDTLNKRVELHEKQLVVIKGLVRKDWTLCIHPGQVVDQTVRNGSWCNNSAWGQSCQISPNSILLIGSESTSVDSVKICSLSSNNLSRCLSCSVIVVWSKF